MKVKRFNNLWAMGLILFGAMLVAFYIAKIFFPEFIVGVAEIPAIVKFGEYVDTHKWAYYLFNGVLSFFILYFYTCACCRIKTLKIIEILFLIVLIIISHILEEFQPIHLTAYNFILYLLMPLLVAFIRNIKDYKLFYSTCVCFVLSTLAQTLSLTIRDSPIFISCHNTATYFVVLIDVYIWNILLYNYFNYKEN